MRKSFLILACLCLLAVTVNAHAVTPHGDKFLRASKAAVNEATSDAPVTFANTRADTICYGGHDGSGYAVLDGIWDFADGTMQGWYGVDLTLNLGATYWDRYTAADYADPASAPMTNASAGHLWCGGENSRAKAECWACDATQDVSYGYGTEVCQRSTSPLMPYSSGDVDVDMEYYTDCEGGNFDYTRVVIIAYDGATELEAIVIDDIDGNADGAPGAPELYSGTIRSNLLPSGTDGVKLRFEFDSDSYWDDQDGNYCTEYGPIGLDDVVVSGGATASYDFESDDEGFVPSACEGVGNWVAVHDIAEYEILDPCDCILTDYVIAFHDVNQEHGDPSSDTNQNNMAVSPIVDRTAYPAPGYNAVFADWDMYAWLPTENGVFYRPGWYFWPWECEYTGIGGWSPRSGQEGYRYVGTDPVCYSTTNSATANGVPGDADYYRFGFEVIACCDCFGIKPNDCTGSSNATPFIDNVRICVTGVADAPVAAYGDVDGNYYQDAFSQSMFLDPTATGRCDSWATGGGTVAPYTLADSLAITGPPSASQSWESKLWVHIPRVGPGINTANFDVWKARMTGDVETGWGYALMDSVESSNTLTDAFCSYFREDDPGFNGAFGEITDENEILPDDLFTPGTLIQYFVTSNWVGNPDFAFLEDTVGGFFRDIEFLPSMRNDGRAIVWPCVLYIDVYNRGAETFIQAALDYFLQEVPGEGPNCDRYDENGGSSNFNSSSFYRDGNNGATLPQLLAYSCILVNTGTFSAGAMEETDMIGLQDWLLTSICDFNDVRQGLIMNGDEIPGIIEAYLPAFLSDVLGVGLTCSPYRDDGCPSGTNPDTSYCVQVIDVGSPVFPTSTDIWAAGNGCPNIFTFSVLFAEGTGQGNRSWFDYDFSGPKGEVTYAQVVNEDLGLNNFRSSVEGYSYHHLTTNGSPTTQCVADSVNIVAATASEVVATLDWMFDGPPPSFCTDPCASTGDVPDIGGTVDVRVNRLFQNRPNPFNPRTVISFSVAQRGKVELDIYDVSGRLVRQLRNETMDAGNQNVVWDGTDDAGHKVTSGIYWSQLKIKDYTSTKKMVLLK